MTIAARFELPSAKNLSVQRAVEIFVPTDLFWEILLSDSNDVVFGTRGSGKTLLLRMMSVNHLVSFAERDKRAAQALFDGRRFGMFLPLGIDWCVAFQAKGDSAVRLFVDGVNLVATEGFIDAVEGLIRAGAIPRVPSDKIERLLCERLVDQWFRPHRHKVLSFLGLRQLIFQQQAILRDLWRDGLPPSARSERDYGYRFRSGSLFNPINDAVRLANAELGLSPEQKWLLCLDELEDLKHDQLRAVATYLRGATSNLVLKVTTQPYTLEGKETDFGDGVSAVDFRDYSIKRLQFDPHQPAFRALAAEILRKRMQRSRDSSSDRLPFFVFGGGTFTDRAQQSEPSFEKLRSRVLEGHNPDSARKKIPVLAIRSLKKAAEGNRRPVAYSGWNAIIALSDGNPGMFVRLLNEFKIGPETETVDAALQHRVVSELAATWHEWSQALYRDGKVLHGIISRLGTELESRLHTRLASEEDVQEEMNRFKVNLTEMDPAEAEAFRVGARHALLVAEAIGASIRYPIGEGVWRLSYALAPKFWLLPRRGKLVRFGPHQLPLDFEASTPGTSNLGTEFEPDIETATSALSDVDYV